MATPAQITANRDNAQHSTGPVTPEGKAASATNATKHGLTAAFSVLPHEDTDEFDELYEGYCDEFNPSTYHETFLVQQMVQARWRLARIQRLEVRLLTDTCTALPGDDDADSAIIASFREKGTAIPTALQRYAAAAERTYHKCHRELTASRAENSRQSARQLEQAVLDYISAPPPRRSATPEIPKIPANTAESGKCKTNPIPAPCFPFITPATASRPTSSPAGAAPRNHPVGF